MDDIIEAIVEIIGSLLEEALKGIKNPKKRKWALTGFYSVLLVVIVGFLLWGAAALFADGNLIGAAVFAVIAVLLSVIFSFFIIRGHKRNWKQAED